MSNLVQRQLTIVLNTFTEDLLLANNIPFVASRNQVVQAGFVADAAGLFLDIFVGSNDIAQNWAPQIRATAFPLANEDFLQSFGMMAGENLKIRVRETSGANRLLRFTLVSNPI